MKYEWPGPDGSTLTANVPANVLPYVEVLGLDGAIRFLQKFGGAELYIPVGTHQQGRRAGRCAAFLGYEKAVELARAMGGGNTYVPASKVLIARYLRSKGGSVNQIAREMHIAYVTARRLLDPDYGNGCGPHSGAFGAEV